MGVTVIIHLFVAVLIDSYFAFIKELQFVLSDKHLESFRDRWLEIDPEGTGCVSVWRLRLLLERLHDDKNPMGSCALADPVTHRAIRLQILTASRHQLGDPSKGETAKRCHDLEYMITFSQTARVLALTVAGSKALPFEEMHQHREALNFFAQASVIAGTMQRFTRYKFRRDVYINQILAHNMSSSGATARGDGAQSDGTQSEACIFTLADSKGVVVVHPQHGQLYLCTLAGKPHTPSISTLNPIPCINPQPSTRSTD